MEKKTEGERKKGKGALPLTYSFVFGPEIEDGGDDESGEERQPETNNPPTSWRLGAGFTTVPTLIRPRQLRKQTDEEKQQQVVTEKLGLKKRSPEHDGLTATIPKLLAILSSSSSSFSSDPNILSQTLNLIC